MSSGSQNTVSTRHRGFQKCEQWYWYGLNSEEFMEYGSLAQADSISPVVSDGHPALNPVVGSKLLSESTQWPDFLIGQPGKPVRVVLVDDDANIRQVISQELLGDLRTDLVGQGDSLREGRRLISQSRFDVMLIDLNLGDGNGFELIEHMKSIHPMAEAIVISAMEDEQHALWAFALGATGYLVKNSWFGNFPQAVLQVVNGGASITPNLARRLLSKLEHPVKPKNRLATNLEDSLTPREKEMLQMVSSGYTSSEIASRLMISAQTVNTHLKNVFRKLQVRSRAQAVSIAATRGLL